MAELIREQPAGTLDRREYWSLSNACEAMDSYRDDVCSIHVNNQSKEDITKDIDREYELRTGIEIPAIMTIDWFLVECKASEVTSLLADLESVC